MSYSSAIFKDYNEDLVKPPELCESLESAQMRKLRCIPDYSCHCPVLTDARPGTSSRRPRSALVTAS